MDDAKIVTGIVTTAASTAGAGSITVATLTSSAPGLLGVIGLTTTTTVALPVAGIVASAGLVTYGVVKVLKWFND
ncbi:MAG: hypothetical protein VKJ02_14870 [Snowella sp.]|nr:hypothetical protein [Snowella sp.]